MSLVTRLIINLRENRFFSAPCINNLFVLMPIAGPNQVQNLKERGPSMYSFSTRPGLDSPVSDKQEMEDVVINPRWQKVRILASFPDKLLFISVLRSVALRVT